MGNIEPINSSHRINCKDPVLQTGLKFTLIVSYDTIITKNRQNSFAFLLYI